MERSPVFQDDIDRNDFVGRLSSLCVEISTPCLAWALIPNHFHLLLQTGSVPVATIMRRLLTGYAVRFNRRHKRSGHLFQNRYKSILCFRRSCICLSWFVISISIRFVPDWLPISKN
ncbi:MAG: transposase [Desulfuromonadales bacterium]|nr:transposase [Desulfuromonadales bacterium]